MLKKRVCAYIIATCCALAMNFSLAQTLDGVASWVDTEAELAPLKQELELGDVKAQGQLNQIIQSCLQNERCKQGIHTPQEIPTSQQRRAAYAAFVLAQWHQQNQDGATVSSNERIRRLYVFANNLGYIPAIQQLAAAYDNGAIGLSMDTLMAKRLRESVAAIRHRPPVPPIEQTAQASTTNSKPLVNAERISKGQRCIADGELFGNELSQTQRRLRKIRTEIDEINRDILVMNNTRGAVNEHMYDTVTAIRQQHYDNYESRRRELLRETGPLYRNERRLVDALNNWAKNCAIRLNQYEWEQLCNNRRFSRFCSRYKWAQGN